MHLVLALLIRSVPWREQLEVPPDSSKLENDDNPPLSDDAIHHLGQLSQ